MHSQADPDAVGSAIALAHFIQQINPNIRIYSFNRDISTLGHKLLQMTDSKLNFIESNHIKPSTLCIFLDTSELLPNLHDLDIKIAIFDHHILTPLETHIDFDFRQESFKATAELVTSLFYHTNVTLTSNIVIGLLTGIIFDTRRFKYADYELFRSVNFLIKNEPGIYSKALTLFSTARPQSEKIACIRAAQRAKRVQISQFNILFSNVSSYEAAAARALISIGADIGIVMANKKEETRISFRCASGFSAIAGVSIGQDIIPAIIEKFGGTGGGHDEAAGYNNNKIIEISKVKDFLFTLLKDLLDDKEKSQIN
jgi:phosphoesterase RecJ-like protein